jgi:CRISPR-associated protein Csm2
MARNYRIHNEVKKNAKQILDGNGKLIVNVSEDIGKQTSGRGGVSTSQIRKIFGDLKRRQYRDFDADQIQLIRPKLAYTFARHGSKKGMDLLLGTLDFLLEKVKEEGDFDNLVNFFESILAYHKKYGGR